MGHAILPPRQPVIADAEPPAPVALQPRGSAADKAAAETDELDEIMTSGERLPVGLFQSELVSERAGVWVDGAGQPILDEEEE